METTPSAIKAPTEAAEATTGGTTTAGPSQADAKATSPTRDADTEKKSTPTVETTLSTMKAPAEAADATTGATTTAGTSQADAKATSPASGVDSPFKGFTHNRKTYVANIRALSSFQNLSSPKATSSGSKCGTVPKTKNPKIPETLRTTPCVQTLRGNKSLKKVNTTGPHLSKTHNFAYKKAPRLDGFETFIPYPIKKYGEDWY